MSKLGFIGAGNMAAAIINGIVTANAMDAADIIASDTDKNRLIYFAENYRVKITQSNTELSQKADIIFLSVKPDVYDSVIEEIKGHLSPNALIVILAAGLSLNMVKEKFGTDSIKLIKTMPNTPSVVNSGMTAICACENVTPDEIEKIQSIFNIIGKTEILPEKLFDAFTGISGSSPAYALMFIEAMADAGVKHGLSRAQAIKISAQSLYGAAKMALETGEHPATLKDAICSPGGTTIAAVCELERQGFRNAVICGVNAAVERYNEMGV